VTFSLFDENLASLWTGKLVIPKQAWSYRKIYLATLTGKINLAVQNQASPKNEALTGRRKKSKSWNSSHVIARAFPRSNLQIYYEIASPQKRGSQ
jgi:hypothetical protein